MVEAGLILTGEIHGAASEEQQREHGCLAGGTRPQVMQAEQGFCDCRRYVNILLLEILMSRKPILASETGGVDFMNCSIISLSIT